MQEIAIVFLIGCVLAALGLAHALPATTVIEGGRDLMLSAAVVGIPTEIVYFAALFAALTRSGLRPSGWFWRPFAHHHLLRARQRYWVLPWYYVGALSFVAIVIGIVISSFGLASLWLSLRSA